MSLRAIYTLNTLPVSWMNEAGWVHFWRRSWQELRLDTHCWAAVTSHSEDRTFDTVSEADTADIHAARRGDSEAYRRLIQRHQGAIAVQMRRFSRDPLTCEELVHEVFVTAYLALGSFRGDAPWLHWLRKVAVRVGYRFWKKRRNQQDIHLTTEDWQRLQGASRSLTEDYEAAELFSRLLNQLSPSDRLILTLLYLDGCSISEAAARAGWTAMGTKLRAFRARNRLRTIIQRGES